MKLNYCRPRGGFGQVRWWVVAALAVGFISWAGQSWASPRTVLPPFPEPGSLFSEGFDQPTQLATNQAVDATVWTESWSGWALNRSSRTPVVTPWVVPVVLSNAFQVDLERGAIRLWYRPEYSGAPGRRATLFSLVWGPSATRTVWFSLEVTADGQALELVCPSPAGLAKGLSAPIQWQAGGWHLLTLGYSPTNTVLFVDEQAVVMGNGLASVPVEAAGSAALIIGSDWRGQTVAAGQLEELTTFTGRLRFRSAEGLGWGVDPELVVGLYYASVSPVAVLGPVTPEEEAARRELAAARRAARLAAPTETASASVLSLSADTGADGYHLDGLEGTNGFWILSPQVVQGTNLLLTVVNGDPSIGYDIWSAPVLSTNPVWNIVATGVVGQTSFTLPLGAGQGWFRAAEGWDWDGDSIPNWMDANPTNGAIGTLSITIDNPSNGIAFN